MTSIGILVSILTLFLSGRQYFIMKDKQLEVPYETFQNSYLQFKVVANEMDAVAISKRPVPLSFYLRHPNENPIELFSIFTPFYSLDFNEKWLDIYYSKLDSVPEEIIKYPTEYFYKNCTYQVPLPVGKFALIGQGRSTFKKKILGRPFGFNVSLEPNQTVYARLVYDKDFNLEYMKIEIIPTPPDIKEIKKCVID